MLQLLVTTLAVVAVAETSSHGAVQECTADGEDSSLLQMSLKGTKHGKTMQSKDFDLASHPTRAPGDTCGLEFVVVPYGENDWAWAYDGWEKCGGMSQSPININPFCKTTKKKYGGKLPVRYGVNNAPLLLGNNGHSVGIDGMWGYLDVPGAGVFQTKNIHWHHPSEHTVLGRQFPLEMHIVHTLPAAGYGDWFGPEDHNVPAGKLAVVGILFEIGNEDNKCLDEFFNKPCPIAGCQRSAQNFDLHECFRKELAGGWYSYGGSLTTPPCTEGVYWHVMETVAKVTAEQLKHFADLYNNDARPTQQLNHRVVLHHIPYCPKVCSDGNQTQTCWDGSVVCREPEHDCNFAPCPELRCTDKPDHSGQTHDDPSYHSCHSAGELKGHSGCGPGFNCVDDAADNCDPNNGSVDCAGCCVPSVGSAA